jgi:hypothetical protein
MAQYGKENKSKLQETQMKVLKTWGKINRNKSERNWIQTDKSGH